MVDIFCCLTDRDGVAAHEGGAGLQMVHEGLVLELALEATGIAEAIPRLNADKGGLLAVRAPKSADGRLVVHRHRRFAIGIHQHSTVRLTLVDLHRVVAEEIVTELNHALIGLQELLHHVVTAIDITLQHIHRLVIIESDLTIELATGHIEGRMTAYLKMDLPLVGILDMPDDMDPITLETIGDGEVETVGIDLQRCF